VFVGRTTNLTGLPLSFQKLETGGVGLLGMKAVAGWQDSLFFVGQDDIYQLSPSGLTPVGTPVVRRTIQQVSSTHHWKICATMDLSNDRVLFGFPKDSNEIEEIWSYCYKTKAWTWEKFNCYMLASNSWAATKTWETWVAADYDTGLVSTTITDATLTGNASTDWVTGAIAATDKVLIDLDGDGTYEFETTVASVTNLHVLEMVLPATATAALVHYRIVKAASTWQGSEIAAYPTWGFLRGSGTTLKDVYPLTYSYVFKYVPNGKNDEDDLGVHSAVPVELVTRDLDFNLPDDEKVFYRLGLKLETWVTENLQFQVYASGDRGQHWKSLGFLNVLANKDEGKVDFRMRGSSVRFKLVSSSDVDPYTITELTMSVRTMGQEVAGREDQT